MELYAAGRADLEYVKMIISILLSSFSKEEFKVLNNPGIGHFHYTT